MCFSNFNIHKNHPSAGLHKPPGVVSIQVQVLHFEKQEYKTGQEECAPCQTLWYNKRHHALGFCRVELQSFFVFVLLVCPSCFPCLRWHLRRVLRELYGCPGYILQGIHTVWESGGIWAWKQCWMTLRCDYAGNDMRRCDYAGNGLNLRSLRGQGYIWQPFGSYLAVVSQQPTTVVSQDNKPEHLHTPQLPTATSEGGTAGSRFSFGGWNRGRAEP